MGTDGMSYSLQSRDLIADSIETVMGAHWYDACVAIPGCDKNMPGCIIAMGRLEPAVADGLRRDDPAGAARQPALDVVSAFQSYGEFIAGRITRRSAGHRPEELPRRGRVRRHVHGEHHGQRHRGHGHEPAGELVDAGHRPGQGRRVPGGGRGDSALLELISSRATS
jgi:hypothetical protein